MVKRTILQRVVGVWLVCCVLASWLQVPVWHDDVSLWRHATIVSPGHPQGWLNLAGAYFVRGDYQDDIQALLVANTVALTTESVSRQHRLLLLKVISQNLAGLYQQQGDQKAADAWRRNADQYTVSGR